MSQRRWSSASAAILVLACQPAPGGDQANTATTSADDEQAITRVIEQEIAAAKANNPDSFMQILVPDATIKPPNEPPISGAAVRTWLENMFRDVSINEMAYNDQQITVSGDLAVHWYGFEWTLTPKSGGQAMQEKGHGVHVLQRQPDGSWKISRDVWSVDTAPPAAAPAR